MTTTDRRFQKYTPKTRDVHAIQFYGLINTVDILIRAGAKVLMVGSGYEHEMRRENEKDHSTGHVRDDARAFLILFHEIQGDWKRERVDPGDWIVWDPEKGTFQAYTAAEFEKEFQQKSHVAVSD